MFKREHMLKKAQAESELSTSSQLKRFFANYKSQASKYTIASLI